MIRNGVDWRDIYVDATNDMAVHSAIVDLACRKSGLKVLDWHVTNEHNRLIGGGSCQDEIMGVSSKRRREMSISELAALPDYQSTKRMTVPEICEALGYDVEIVKGGE